MWWVYHGNWVVQVNGYKVSEGDLDLETDRLQVIQESRGMNFQGEQGRMLKEQLRQLALGQLVDRALMCQAARKSGISVDQAEVKSQLMLIQMQLGGAENLQQFLKEQGLTEAGYKELVEESLIIERLWDHITRDVTVEEDETRQTYQELKEMLVFPERVKVGHILVKTEEEAREVILELKGGADFQELAVQRSVDPSVAENKGILDDISKDSPYIEGFKEEAFRLSPGEFSQEPVKTELGYHVLWSFERKDAGQAGYDDVKDLLQRQLLSDKKQEKLMDYMESVRRAGRIMYHPKKTVIPV